MDYIKLKEKKDIYRLGIIDENGNVIKDKDEKEVCIEFDLGDIELPLKYNRCIKTIEDSRRYLRNQFLIIDKKQNHKRKGLSTNDELKAKALQNFYKEIEKAMDLFLGEGGTKKFLNGRKPYWEMPDDIAEAIEPYMDKLQLKTKDMTDRIKAKYQIEESDVLKSE